MLWRLAVCAVVLGFGAVSCGTLLGCHNPTGYCGDNVPDPDRIGGPSWVLSTTPEERTAFYRERCVGLPDEFRVDATDEACTRRKIREEVFDACVYYETPRWVEDGPTEEERQRDRAECQRKVLNQHGLRLLPRAT